MKPILIKNTLHELEKIRDLEHSYWAKHYCKLFKTFPQGPKDLKIGLFYLTYFFARKDWNEDCAEGNLKNRLCRK